MSILIKVNRNDGKTLSFDLSDEEGALASSLNNNKFMETITGIGCLHNTFWHTLTKPKKFKNVRYSVEKVKQNKSGIVKDIGEKIICQADDVQLSVLVYYNIRPKMARIEIKKIGKQRFAPHKGLDNGNSNKEDNKLCKF